MQFIGLVAIIILLFLQHESIKAAPTDSTSPGESDNDSNSQLIDTGMTHGSQHHHKDKKNIDYYDYRHVVADGVQKALDECRQKFKWDRWNCPKKAFLSILDREEFSSGQDTLPSNKELGLTRAMIASSIVLSMIKSCNVSKKSMCACTNPTVVSAQNGNIFLQEHKGISPISSIGDLPQHSHADAKQNQNEMSTIPAPQIAEPLTMQDAGDMNAASEQATFDQSKSSKWAGCDEIVKFGFKVAKMYLDLQDTVQGEASRLINAHNYEAGRQAVKKMMRVKCSCYGPSANCQFRSCWTVVPDISEVGDYLKRQYHVAAKVGAISAKETDAASLKEELSAISPEKLVFADASPDYCYENKQFGINGTLGRYCSRTKHRTNGTDVSRSERDSCDRLCTKCGYKIKRESVNVDTQCDCRFVFCCAVECKWCKRQEETYRCVRHS